MLGKELVVADDVNRLLAGADPNDVLPNTGADSEVFKAALVVADDVNRLLAGADPNDVLPNTGAD